MATQLQILQKLQKLQPKSKIVTRMVTITTKIQEAQRRKKVQTVLASHKEKWIPENITRAQVEQRGGGAASPEYGQTLIALALAPVAAHTLIPAISTMGTGASIGAPSFIASTAAKMTLRKGLMLGGGALGAVLLGTFLGGQKLSQEQQGAITPTAAPQTTDQDQRQAQKTFTYDYSTKTTTQVTTQDIYNVQTAGGDITAAPSIYGTQTAAIPSAYGTQEQAQQAINWQDLISSLGQYQEATQKQDQSGLILIIAALGIGAMMFLKD